MTVHPHINTDIFRRAEYVWTHLFALSWIFLTGSLGQFLKSSIQLNAMLKEALKLTFFCSVTRWTSVYYKVPTLILNKFLILRSLILLFLESSGHTAFVICIQREIAESFLGLPLISFPFSKQQFQDFLH